MSNQQDYRKSAAALLLAHQQWNGTEFLHNTLYYLGAILDGTEFLHNTLYSISISFLRTGQGVLDQENSQGQRIGDRVTLSGVGFKMMLELSKRYSDVTFRMLIIRV